MHLQNTANVNATKGSIFQLQLTRMCILMQLFLFCFNQKWLLCKCQQWCNCFLAHFAFGTLVWHHRVWRSNWLRLCDSIWELSVKCRHTRRLFATPPTAVRFVRREEYSTERGLKVKRIEVGRLLWCAVWLETLFVIIIAKTRRFVFKFVHRSVLLFYENLSEIRLDVLVSSSQADEWNCGRNLTVNVDWRLRRVAFSNYVFARPSLEDHPRSHTFCCVMCFLLSSSCCWGETMKKKKQ